MNRRNQKGTLEERCFVWGLGLLFLVGSFYWTQSRIPFENCDVLTQWIDSIIPSILAGLVGILTGYTIVLWVRFYYRRRR